jgi:peptidoglycan hydrolase CwlO-like protein
LFIFKSKNQKKINKLYREIEEEYKKLDRLKEELHKNREKPELSASLRNDISATNENIKQLKIQVIKLED